MLKRTVLLSLMIYALFSPVADTAQAFVINDNRLDQLFGNPSLGRGYNMKENALKGSCFAKITSSAPVFDFYYEIDDLDKDFVRSLSGNKDQWAVNQRLFDFIRRHQQVGDNNLSDNGETIQTVVARVVIESYYKTLDESGTELSEPVMDLLKADRIVDFFEICGFHYIKSIRFHSSFTVLLQYDLSKTHLTDEELSHYIEYYLLSGKSEGNGMQKFQKLADDNNIKIFVQANGLNVGKNPVSLVPMSIHELKETLKEVAKAMQDDNSGVVSSIELTPWIQNPQLAGITQKNNLSNQNYQSRLNLEFNSQLISAITDGYRFYLDQFFRANLCNKALVEQYPTEQPSGTEKLFKVFNPDTVFFVNHRYPDNRSSDISLRQFKDYFTKKSPSAFLHQAQEFYYGKNLKDGAKKCIDSILEAGLGKKNYHEISDCDHVIKSIFPTDIILEQYCLPTYYNSYK